MSGKKRRGDDPTWSVGVILCAEYLGHAHGRDSAIVAMGKPSARNDCTNSAEADDLMSQWCPEFYTRFFSEDTLQDIPNLRTSLSNHQSKHLHHLSCIFEQHKYGGIAHVRREPRPTRCIPT